LNQELDLLKRKIN